MTSKARQLADLGGDTANLEDISSVLSSGPLSNRNLIINGAMTFDQRSSGSYVTVNGGGIYTLDRWRAYDSTDGVFTLQQVADAPAGFISSAKATVTTADASLTGFQQAKFQQRIEGYNAASLALGTSGAKTFTLSFWVKSSVTGTYAVGFMNAAGDRSFVSTYSISSANTWEYKTITIAGDTTGTWRVDNITGLNIQWSLGMGPDATTSTGSWQAGELSHASGAVNLLATLNATWQITGVQLEVGDTATPFEHRSYGQELALCQRYYTEFGDGSSGGAL